MNKIDTSGVKGDAQSSRRDSAARDTKAGRVSSSRRTSPAGRRRIILLTVGALALITLVVVLLLSVQPAEPGQVAGQQFGGGQPGQGPGGQAPNAAIEVPAGTQTFVVRAEKDREGVEVSGNMLPGDAEDLTSRVAAQVLSVPVHEGDKVNAGDVLVVLDSASLRYEIESLRFEIEQEELSGSPRKVELLRMQLALKQQNLAHYTVRAGIAGTVSTIDVKPGQSVAAGAALARVIDSSWLRAEVGIDELDIPKVQLGQEVEVELDALSGTALFGRVARIGSEGTPTGNGYSTILVELQFREVDSRVLPGFSFSGSIYVASEEQAMVVDRRAVQTINDRDGVVFVVTEDGATATPVPVQYASFGQLNYKLLDGVEIGAKLMTAPNVTGSRRMTFPGGGFGPTGGGPGGGVRIQTGPAFR